MEREIDDILAEDERRNREIDKAFNPVTGEGSIGERRLVEIPDMPLSKMWLPTAMLKEPFVRKLVKAQTLQMFLFSSVGDTSEQAREMAIEKFERLRVRHDFPYWAYCYVRIKNKDPEGQPEIPLRLSRPQRKFVSLLEELRLRKEPIRVVLLKARQWGGSTVSQTYMAWFQLVRKKGLNSLIVGQVTNTAAGIRDMFDRLLRNYPVESLHQLGAWVDDNEPKAQNVGAQGLVKRIPQRDCKIAIGSAISPDSVRGADYSLVHCSEVGLWKRSEGNSPQDTVRAACAGVLYRPNTMIVYESTANGTGNFFQKEYDDAKNRETTGSQFHALFVSWFDIDLYRKPFEGEEQRRQFAQNLYSSRNDDRITSPRRQPGEYLWWLWERGATLEAINWYVSERAGKDSQQVMASEYPTDDVEAFVNTGAGVFDRYRVEALRPSCRKPLWTGELTANGNSGKEALQNVHFAKDECGKLDIWEMPEIVTPEDRVVVTDRYLVAVDVGGRSSHADFSVVAVFDRLLMGNGGLPSIVAQWYGHCDIDMLAWKAAQIAAYYSNALLVIESNTLETRDPLRNTDGDASAFILNQLRDAYPNLYARRATEEAVKQGAPLRYGFHTNVQTKVMVIANLIRVVRDGLYTERDARCLDEYLTYEQRQNGSYGAVVGKHDDLLMTRAIGLHICYNEMPLPQYRQIGPHTSSAYKPIISTATI